MAEIRKFTPSQGGDIAQALAKAMGEPVRPLAPGQDRPVPQKKPAAPASPTVISGAIWDPFLKTQPRTTPSGSGALGVARPAEAPEPAQIDADADPDEVDGGKRQDLSER